MRVIAYAEAVEYCFRLAERIRAHLGQELAEARFVAIPRGGLIVLGILSYVLNLRREQIEGWGGAESKCVVIVDDCSLSGARFGVALQRVDAPHVVFAHLFSHPKLRQAILESEPRVQACLAAEDLVERQDWHPADPVTFWAQWRKRLPDHRYWLGAVEPIAFAWNEPDKVLWNERKGRLEDDWNQASPRVCLNNWLALGVPRLRLPAGRLDVPSHVFWKIEQDEVILWHSKEDQVYGLKGVAGAMWRALVAYGDFDQAVAYLVNQYQVEESTLRQDLSGFIRELLAKGLLEGVDATDLAKD